MTIASTTRRVAYNGDGETTVFPVTFKYFATTDVKVVHVDADGAETAWTAGAEFDFTGDGAAVTGSVAVRTAPDDHTPAVGEKLVILLQPALTQGMDLPDDGAHLDSIEQAADRAAQRDLYLLDQIARAPKFPESAALTDIPLPLPDPGKALRWSDGGDALVNSADDFDDVLAAATASAAAAAASAASASGNAAAAEAAQSAAEAARDAAESAVDGAVKVSANDAARGYLLDKLAAGSGIAITETGDGGDEDATIALAYASQGEAEAGSATDKPLNALRTAQAIAAQALRPGASSTLTAGFTTDLYAIGSSGTGTVTVSLTQEAMQTLTVDGSFTLAPPSSGNGRAEILATNDGSGGHAMTTSGFAKVVGSYNNAAGAENLLRVTRNGSLSLLEILDLTA